MEEMNRGYATPGEHISPKSYNGVNTSQIDPPDDEPPSLKIESMEENEKLNADDVLSPSRNPNIDDQGFFRVEPAPEGHDNFSSDHVSPVSASRHNNQNAFQSNEFDDEFQVATDVGAHVSEGLVQEGGAQIAHHENNQYSNEKSGYPDEKKIGIEQDEEALTEEIESKASPHRQPYNDIDPIDTSHTRPVEYDEPSPHPFSPADVSTNSAMESSGHQSPAMRGAHEILKRNRRKRAES